MYILYTLKYLYVNNIYLYINHHIHESLSVFEKCVLVNMIETQALGMIYVNEKKFMKEVTCAKGFMYLISLSILKCLEQ